MAIESKTTKRARRLALILYRITDFGAAALAWFLFFSFRKKYELSDFYWSYVLGDQKLYIGLLLIPLGWLILYFLFDRHDDVYRLSRPTAVVRTFFISLGGTLFLFFTILADDIFLQYRTYVVSFLVLFFLHFVITLFGRLILLSIFRRQVVSGAVWFNTILIGNDEKALNIYRDICNAPVPLGYKIIGYVSTNGNRKSSIDKQIRHLGSSAEIPAIIEKYQIEEVIIAIETQEHSKLTTLLDNLSDSGDRIYIKIIPDMYDILFGSVKMRHIYGLPLIELDRKIMPRWESMLKRSMDILLSLLVLIILSPVILYIGIRVSLDSPGPVLFRQERIGKNRKAFQILKFRSMYRDAEKDGPQLSYVGDVRCTPWGAKMRKWRVDEIPQFVNVLRSEMSLVGPRPERTYYIKKIMKSSPHYKHIFRVRPGITSLGQVKYGYASDIEQMLKRLKFDLIYLENMSIGLDIKILFYTLIVLFKGQGK